MSTSLRPKAVLSVVSAAIAGVLLSACTSTAPEASGDAIAVTSSDEACEIGATTAPAGAIRFAVTNTGSDITEFYVYGSDGETVLAEVENIGPGISRELVLEAAPGAYILACKPGMTGDGIRSEFTVTGDPGGAPASSGEDAAAIATAVSAYGDYVDEQAALLLEGTRDFASAYASGKDDVARSMYAPTRVHWERIEPVAESFGDLDPILDAREADLEPGQEWSGWHMIEKDLWPPADGYQALTDEQREEYSTRLVADTEELVSRTATLEYRADQLGNGAKELLDEIATGKITGEEEIWSHTDLWDFQANIDGARVMYSLLRPVVEKRDLALAATLDERFDAVQKLLDGVRQGDGFVSYADLAPEQVRELAAAVDALGEPLSTLTATVLLPSSGS